MSASAPSSRARRWSATIASDVTPAPADSVDWRRGNYTVLARGGRVDSPAGSGELKKQIQMVADAWLELDTTNGDYRQILEQYQSYNRALATNLPFPKTRRIVFIGNRPATMPGWVELSVEE